MSGFETTTPLPSALRQAYTKKCKKNPGFSLRAFAKQLKIQPATLSEILREKRSVSKKYARGLLERLALEEVDIARIIQTIPEKKKAAAAADYRELTFDELELVSKWYYFAILSLSKTEGFDGRPITTARRLGISPGEARQVSLRDAWYSRRKIKSFQATETFQTALSSN